MRLALLGIVVSLLAMESTFNSKQWHCVKFNLGKEDCDVGSISETFQRNPAGNQTRPVESGQQSEASLAWSSATAATKRRQRVCRALLLSPEILCQLQESTSLPPTGTVPGRRHGLTPSVLPGSENRACTHGGSPGT
jgi:hypothetical protein